MADTEYIKNLKSNGFIGFYTRELNLEPYFNGEKIPEDFQKYVGAFPIIMSTIFRLNLDGVQQPFICFANRHIMASIVLSIMGNGANFVESVTKVKEREVIYQGRIYRQTCEDGAYLLHTVYWDHCLFNLNP